MVLSMNVKVVEEKNSFIQNKKCKFPAAFFVHPKSHLYKLWTEVNFLTYFVQSPF